ncbi:MAG: hypothetical protein IPG04_27710 [Polyangiaceae bacterium]|nr:hypothetical protein [Polyangiaceae bacterium]
MVVSVEQVSARAWPASPVPTTPIGDSPWTKCDNCNAGCAAAKRHPERRFHALYDRIARCDVLAEAWKRVRRNKGAAGVDAQTIAVLEAYGVEKLLGEIHDVLRAIEMSMKPSFA